MIYATSAAEIEARRRAFKCKAVADSLEEAGDRLFTFTRLPVQIPTQIAAALLLAPDLDRDLGVAPQRLAVEPGGFLQCLLDTVEGARLAHPTGQVGERVVWQAA